ncbi:MAG: hypothetical protein HQK81_09065 [Desulfovibrionaceae bacterium]|nr:hypothetical protein [Desulfovibrionaceae bacterium]MBF0514194.1 hypothetical protein [Desulfovibrionaceae bacterium]
MPKKGLARVEILALKEQILDWIDQGYPLKIIHNTLLAREQISDRYKYDTFRNTFNSIMKKAKKKPKKQIEIINENAPIKRRFEVDNNTDFVGNKKDK